MHLIVPFAASVQLPLAALQDLNLPNLRTLLTRLQCTLQDADPDLKLPPSAMPHERALARALGWSPNGPWPWAAWQRQSAMATPQAWITPCHWQIGMNDVVMLDPSALQLSDDESQQLLQAMQEFFKEDGLDVTWHSALAWHAQGAVFDGLQTASLDRVVGVDVRPWITAGQWPAHLQRLQSEMQMLLYNHPVNDARLSRRQLPVNSFWVHGAGTLPPNPEAPSSTAQVRWLEGLRLPALHGDVRAWQAAWQHIDQVHLLPYTALPEAQTLQLTLCSESAAHTHSGQPRSWLTRLRRQLNPPHPSGALQALLKP